MSNTIGGVTPVLVNSLRPQVAGKPPAAQADQQRPPEIGSASSQSPSISAEARQLSQAFDVAARDGGLTHQVKFGENSFRAETTQTGPGGLSRSRSAQASFDADAGSFSREVVRTGPRGAEWSRQVTVTQTEAGFEYTHSTTATGRAGNSRSRDVIGAYDAASGRVTGEVDITLRNGQQIEKTIDRVRPPAPQPPPLLDIMRDSFFASAGDENFNAEADLNGDNVVNFLDLGMLAAQASENDVIDDPISDPTVELPVVDSAGDSGAEQGLSKGMDYDLLG